MDPFVRVDFNYGQIFHFVVYGGLLKAIKEFCKFLLVLALTFYLGIFIFQMGNELIPPQTIQQTSDRQNSADRVYPHVVEIPLKISEDILAKQNKNGNDDK